MRPFGDLGEPQVELREVDQHDQVRRVAAQEAGETPIGPHDGAEFVRGLEQGHAGDVLGLDQNTHTGRAQRRAADAEHVEPGGIGRQRAHEVGAVRVARGFPGHEQDAARVCRGVGRTDRHAKAGRGGRLRGLLRLQAGDDAFGLFQGLQAVAAADERGAAVAHRADEGPNLLFQRVLAADVPLFDGDSGE